MLDRSAFLPHTALRKFTVLTVLLNFLITVWNKKSVAVGTGEDFRFCLRRKIITPWLESWDLKAPLCKGADASSKQPGGLFVAKGGSNL